FCCVLDALPLKSRLAPRLMLVSTTREPIAEGSTDTLLSLSKLVPAFLLAWVVSCSTTVTRSPARKARLSQVIDQAASTTQTPPLVPRRGALRVAGGGSSIAVGRTCGGARVEQPDASSAAQVTRHQRSINAPLAPGTASC